MDPFAQPVLYAGMALLDLFDGTGDDLRLAERRRRAQLAPLVRFHFGYPFRDVAKGVSGGRAEMA
jgi:hypothetical protein